MANKTKMIATALVGLSMVCALMIGGLNKTEEGKNEILVTDSANKLTDNQSGDRLYSSH